MYVLGAVLGSSKGFTSMSQADSFIDWTSSELHFSNFFRGKKITGMLNVNYNLSKTVISI